MIPKFRAYDKITKKMYDVEAIEFVHVATVHPVLNITVYELETATFRKIVRGNFELMQFTGLHDNHKKEIFTDDTMKFKLNTKYGLIEKTGVVRCESLAEGCYVNFLPDELDGIPLDSNVIEPEVIGNKYEGVKS